MKYVIIIPDGAADEPIDSLGGKTPLMVAKTPHLDRLAKRSIIGRSWNVPEHLSPGSDVATLSLLGYDPSEVYTGRAPLEAIAQNIHLGPDDLAFRCNLVCIEQGVMKSFTAGHISSEEAREILKTLQFEVASQWNSIASRCGLDHYAGRVDFYPGVSYRNLMVFSPQVSGSMPFAKLRTCPPHDYTDQQVEQALPAGDGSKLIGEVMELSASVLASHPVNHKRIRDGKLPATHAWLWGQGRTPNMVSFAQRHPKIRSGKMITAVDLLRGIARSIGWDIVDVPNITGYVDTDYSAKGRYAAANIADNRIVCVHVEATDESGHEGSVAKKVAALEDIDSKVLPPVLDALAGQADWRILITPDHPTPVRIKTHSRGFVPWLIAGSDIEVNRPDQTYDEVTAEKSEYHFEHGWELINFFLGER